MAQPPPAVAPVYAAVSGESQPGRLCYRGLRQHNSKNTSWRLAAGGLPPSALILNYTCWWWALR
ncbi:MAG: hypothetical protein ACREJM_16375, partial [Candidatus Saccharimonadales bacterium]